MTKQKSTTVSEIKPTPWIGKTRFVSDCPETLAEMFAVHDEAGDFVAAFQKREDRDKAVRVMNSHPALLTAVNTVLAAWENSKYAPSAPSAMAEIRVAVQQLFEAMLPNGAVGSHYES